MSSSKELFRYYKGDSKIFIETGTWTGDGIQCAIDSGYEYIYSCDINQEKVEMAEARFTDKAVEIYNDPSVIALEKIFAKINEKCVIFLDGHSMPFDELNPSLGFGDETVSSGNPPCPLLDELDIIKNHAIKEHTILIDDYQCFGTWVFGGITFDQVLATIYQINSKYVYKKHGNVVCFKVYGFPKINRALSSIEELFLNTKKLLRK